MVTRTKSFSGATVACLVLASAVVSAAPLPEPPVSHADLSLERLGSVDQDLADALKLLNSGKPAEGETLVREVLAVQPRSAAGHEILGAALAMQGKLDEAVAALTEAVEINPGQATAFTKLGDIALARGEVASAVEYFQQAIEAEPTEHRAHQRLGLHYESLGNSAAAIEHLEKGIAGTPPEYLGVKRNLARLYVGAGKYAEAIALLQRWSTDFNERAEVHRTLGIAHFGDGELPKAIAHLQAAVSLNPADTASFSLLVDAIRDHGDAALGIDTYRALLGSGNAAIGVHGELGILLQGQGDFAQAEQVYLGMIEKFPLNTEGYFLLGGLYGFLTRYDEASGVYREGLEIAAENAGLLRGASASELRRGDARAALEFAKRLQAVGPDSAVDAFSRGLIFERLEDSAMAERSYREALALQPEHWPSLNNLAVILVQAGRVEEGLALAERAAGLAGDNPSVVHTLGWAHYKNNDARQAVVTLERALQLRPDAAIVNYHLGRARLARGDEARGLELVRRALELDGDFVYAAEARALLER